MHPIANQLWGDLDIAENRVDLNATDRDILTRLPRPLPLEGPRIHQPDQGSVKVEQVHQIIRIPDGYVSHGIGLLNHISELRRLQSVANHRRDRGLPPPQEPLPLVPSFNPPNPVSHLGPFTPRRTVSKSPFSAVEPEFPIMPLDCHSSRQILHQSVAATCAFVGFDLSTDSALDVLTDVTADYLNRFCSILRSARDNELSGGGDRGFADILSRAYTEMGVGNSLLDIRSFYKNSVVGRHGAIVNECQSALVECKDAFEAAETVVENGTNLTDDDNIPEIHFPSSEEGDNGSSVPPTLTLDHNAPQIEPGLQMLQSLEQGGYGNMDSQPSTSASNSGVLNHDEDSMQQPMSHDSNAALLLATVSPGSSSTSRKRRKTSDKMFM